MDTFLVISDTQFVMKREAGDYFFPRHVIKGLLSSVCLDFGHLDNNAV
jgi:type I restriction-modification system DNA methylase subunit